MVKWEKVWKVTIKSVHRLVILVAQVALSQDSNVPLRKEKNLCKAILWLRKVPWGRDVSQIKT